MAEDILKTYLCHCYLYYAKDEPVISDHEFDMLCLKIRKEWDKLESPFKQFIFDYEHGEIETLKGQSMLADQYPEAIKMRAEAMVMEHEDLKRMMNA